MASPPITADLDRFLLAFVRTHEQLKSLLLLRRNVRRPWTVEQAAHALAIDKAQAEAALRELADVGIIAAAPGNTTDEAIYSGPKDAFRGLVDALGYAFEHHQTEVITAMNRHAVERLRVDALRAFADAFAVRQRDG